MNKIIIKNIIVIIINITKRHHTVALKMHVPIVRAYARIPDVSPDAFLPS